MVLGNKLLWEPDKRKSGKWKESLPVNNVLAAEVTQGQGQFTDVEFDSAL